MPQTCIEKNIALYLYKHHYCVIWKNSRNPSLLNAAREVKDIFQYIGNKIDNKNLQNFQIYTFLFKKYRYELHNVLVFDIETFNEREHAIAYATGLYNISRSKHRYKRDLKDEEIITERNAVNKSKAIDGNSVMQMVDYINKYYERDKMVHEKKTVPRIVQSY